MKVSATKLLDCYILEPQVHKDSRGWFMESWSQKKMEEAGLSYAFVQDNHAFSEKAGTLRGIHLQVDDYAQAKLVQCARGAILDLAVDLRQGSPTYKHWALIELNEGNKKQLLLPRGFGHAYLTLCDGVEVVYKTDNFYHPPSERSIYWNDPELAVQWPLTECIISDKDAKAPLLTDSAINITYEEVPLSKHI